MSARKSHFTPAEIRDFAAAYERHGGDRRFIIKKLGLSPSGYDRRKRYALSWNLIADPTRPIRSEPITVTPVEKVEPLELARLREKNSRLEAQLREIQRDELTDQDVRQFILKLAAETPEPPKWLEKPAPAATGVAGIPSALWSDWHLGETVSLSETNGVNEYGLAIAEARIRRLVDRTIDLVFHHMTGARGPGIVVNLGGDMVSGGIHPELAESDEDELFPVILWAVERIAAGLSLLADKFGRVFVPCVPGNHGRVFDRKPRAKRYVHRNADWLIYCLLERHFQTVGDRRIQFFIPDTGEALYRVYHHRYMTVHGDDLGVKGGDGIIGALGPIMRGEIKMHNSSAQIDRDYDTLLMGHWHQTLWLPRAHVNNTLKGYDEYARRMLRAPATAPEQLLWFTHPKRGRTFKVEVQVEDGAPAGGEAGWVSWKEVA